MKLLANLLRVGCALLPAFAAAAPAGQADGEWSLPARDYASTRFSPLHEVNRANVKSLKVAFTFSTSVLRGHEAAPLVVGRTLFIVSPYPNVLYALDLSKPGAPLK